MGQGCAGSLPLFPGSPFHQAGRCLPVPPAGVGAAKGASEILTGYKTLRITRPDSASLGQAGEKLILGHLIFIESLGRAQGPWLNQRGCICPLTCQGGTRTLIQQEGWDSRVPLLLLTQVSCPISQGYAGSTEPASPVSMWAGGSSTRFSERTGKGPCACRAMRCPILQANKNKSRLL